MKSLLYLAIAIALALVHLFAGRMRFLEVIPRSRWLSFAGGVAVAFVLVHLLPELTKAQSAVQRKIEALQYFETHVYVVALFGLAVFYGLERSAKRSRRENRNTGKGDVTSPLVFWLHLASYSIYNLLIGYLLVHREEQDIRTLTFFSLAMALHFVANDYGLRQDHKQSYHRIGRWVLSAAVPIGCIVGLRTTVSQAQLGILFAFLSGGVILNVFKEELPEERESRFWSFAAGVCVYTTLLLLTAR